MRKIGALLIAVACVVMMAVPALAYTEVDISGHTGITVQDGNTYLATVPVSTLNDEGKGYWDKAMQVLTGQSSDYKVILRYNAGSYVIDLFAVDAVMTVVSGAVRVSSQVARLSYSASSNKLYYYPRTGVATDMLGVYISWGDFELPDTSQIATYEGQFGIIDDINGMPEPEPPTPSVPDYVPPEPVIPPGDGKYVPYDTSVWQRFIDHIRGNIGSVVNIGWLIMAAIAGVTLIRQVVKAFAK